MQTFALIPAAGKSARMGRPKLSLPLGNLTVLERLLGALRPLAFADILVVLGPGGSDLHAIANCGSASVLLLGEDTPDMRATVERGMAWLEEQHRPGPDDAFLLCPADHPTLDAGVALDLMKQAESRSPPATIWVPTFAGRRGHPALISWRHVNGIRALPAGVGLNRYLREHDSETLEMPSNSPDILCDLDTPDDYERLRARYEAR